MKIDLEQIRHLLSVVSQTDITELTIESGDEKITVKKSNSQVALGQAPAHIELAAVPVPVAARQAVQTMEAPRSEAKNNGADSGSLDSAVQITSPMVGTFYRAPSPSAPAFVDVGDRVNVGQTVCIIEAMKLMNDLPSEVSGKILKVLVDNGTTVEFGQPLFLVDPQG